MYRPAACRTGLRSSVAVMILAGLQAIPRSYYEAASIDGASAWQTFRYIFLPLAVPIMAVVFVLSFIGVINDYPIASVLIALAVNEVLRTVKGHKPIPANEAVRLMNTEDAIVVDTRSAADFKKSHILNAKHVPMAGIEERAKEISKNTDRTIICYCGIGNVAPQAVAKLRKLGYTRAYALKGGINAWQGDGMPVTSK